MMFRHPQILWALLAVPPVLWLRFRARRGPEVTFSEARLLGGLPRSLRQRLLWLPPLCYGVGLMLAVIALARPQRGLGESWVEAEAVDIVLLLDISTSMLAQDMTWEGRRTTRLEAARAATVEFIRSREGDRIGLIAFAGMPFTIAPLTFDHRWVIDQVERVDTDLVTDGTAIGTAIAAGVNRLRESEALSRVVVLLTDGANNAGTLTPLNAAQVAATKGVRVYAIGFGSDEPAPVEVPAPFGGTRTVYRRFEIDFETLDRIAEMTGGLSFEAGDTERLRQVYAEIDEMERTEMEIRHLARFEDRFAPLVGFSLALLALGGMLELGGLGRLP